MFEFFLPSYHVSIFFESTKKNALDFVGVPKSQFFNMSQHKRGKRGKERRRRVPRKTTGFDRKSMGKGDVSGGLVTQK